MIVRGGADADRVPLTQRQRNALRSELNDLLFRFCGAAGLIAGFLWAYNRPAPDAPPSCDPSGERVAGCFGDALVANLMPYGLAMGAGALIGAVVGAALIRLLLRRRAKPGGRPGGQAGRWITARYEGACRSCRSPIAPGDRIRHKPGHTLCVTCGA